MAKTPALVKSPPSKTSPLARRISPAARAALGSIDQLAKKETVLITGASTGIGLEFAIIFAAGGSDLVLVARNKERLEKLAEECRAKFGVKCFVLPKDLSRPTTPDEIARELKAANISVDILVNNAGRGLRGFFYETDLATELEMLQVNAVSLVHLTKLLLPEMIRKGKGGILNVASTAAFQPGPLMSVYYASKAFVLSFSEALHNELKGKGVGVTCLCPGPTDSEFQERAKMGRTLLFKYSLMSAHEVAEIGVRALRKGRSSVVAGLGNKILAQGTRLVPRQFSASLARFVQRQSNRE